jgi:acyl-coenzyme A thioesterase PaaI-like protein
LAGSAEFAGNLVAALAQGKPFRSGTKSRMQVDLPKAAAGRLERVGEGPWADWATWANDPFEMQAGPFYCRWDEEGEPVCAFRVEPRHMNASAGLHGGCMMAFADFALFIIAWKGLGEDGAVTASFSGDFLGSVGIGALVECRGEIVKSGRSMVFVRGLITSGPEPIMSFQAVMKKTKLAGITA